MIASSEQTVLKFENRDNLAEVDSVVVEDEVEKIRREFDAAKKSFLNIPEALKEMPKMNPEGLLICFVFDFG